MVDDSWWASNIPINEEHSQVDTIILFSGYYLHAAVDRGIRNVSFIAVAVLWVPAWGLRMRAST